MYIYIYSFGPSPYKLHKISQDVQPFLHNTELLMQVVPQPMTSSMASSMGVPSCTICGMAGQGSSTAVPMGFNFDYGKKQNPWLLVQLPF
jgi:hypothetical protein